MYAVPGDKAGTLQVFPVVAQEARKARKASRGILVIAHKKVAVGP